MYKIILCTLFSLIYGNSLSDGNITKLFNHGNRIVGGTDAPEGKFPYMVSLRLQIKYHICGGSIMNKRWILTAAHCTDSVTANSLSVVVGTNSVSKGGQRYQVEKIVNNNFDSKTAQKDISVIKVDKDIVFSDTVQPIALPDRKPGDNDDVILCGWGNNTANSKPDKLQMVNLKTLSIQNCRQRVLPFGPFTINNSNVCALGKKGQASCVGDSGGPLAEGNTVVGLVSWAKKPCGCGCGYPTVFTSVYFYKDWIQNNIKV